MGVGDGSPQRFLGAEPLVLSQSPQNLSQIGLYIYNLPPKNAFSSRNFILCTSEVHSIRRTWGSFQSLLILPYPHIQSTLTSRKLELF